MYIADPWNKHDSCQIPNEANLGPPSEWIMMQVLYHDRYQDKT